MNWQQSPYYRQAELMLRVLSYMNEYDFFALKGGTAMNFFWREMPRISVDIDLTYLPIKSREQSLLDISQALKQMTVSIKKGLPGSRVQKHFLAGTEHIFKLSIWHQDATTKIEPNTVLRGSLYPTEERDLVKAAEECFELTARVKNLSFPELYAGKLCAALSRQHPRDLFDVKLLLENEGLTKEIRQAFVVYVASGNRPISEMLNPIPKDIQPLYVQEFAGMTRIEITAEELFHVLESLPDLICKQLTSEERQFLLSVKQGDPQWSLMPFQGLDKFPALQWKLRNVKKMSRPKQQQAIQKLKKVLEL